MFGRGKIDISIQKTSFAPGDTISGSIDLTLKKAVKAREISISLIGEDDITVSLPGVTDPTVYRGTGMMGGLMMGGTVLRRRSWARGTTTKRTVRTYDLKQCLGNEKEYREGQECCSFGMKIPSDILHVEPRISGRPRWYLLAKLDIAEGLEVSKKRRIRIG
jgi:hypothetical protein